MDLRQIEIFHTVMTCGTASRAAEILGISQPAVSKSIKGLERSVDFALFERGKGRLIPTAEGQLFFREVDSSIHGLSRLRTSAARIHDFGSGDIRIACLSAFSANLLPVALSKFLPQHPDIAITLQVMSSSAVRDLIVSSQFDLGIAADEVDTAGLDFEPFAELSAAIALYPGHPLSSLEVVSPADLHELPFVALAPEDTARRKAESMFESLNVRPRIVVETPYSSTVCALVLSGLGCGIVNPITAPGFVEQGLILKRFEPSIYFRTLLLFPADRPKSEVVKSLVNVLHKQKEIAMTYPYM
jgi:DNA-binding transcriptional LysR family regulator